MHLFTEETNPAGRYIRFGSVGSFRAQTGPDGIGELIRALTAATGQHSPSQIAAWENSLSDLAFLLADPEGYAALTEEQCGAVSSDLAQHADALRRDLSQLLSDVDSFDSYVGISGKLMTPDEMADQKELCRSVRERAEELRVRMFGSEEGTSTIGLLQERMEYSQQVFRKDLDRWHKRQRENPCSIPEDTEVLLEFPLEPVRALPARIDVVLRRGDRAAVIEQKQWTESYATDKRPDEQAARYVERLGTAAGWEGCLLRGFAYLHNQLFYNGNLFQGREFNKERPYLYTRHFCCSMYRELAVFLSEKTE